MPARPSRAKMGSRTTGGGGRSIPIRICQTIYRSYRRIAHAVFNGMANATGQELLLQPDLSLAMVAEKIGYESDISFSRAFKRHVGEPPARWRECATSLSVL